MIANPKPLRNLKRRLAGGLSSWLDFEFKCKRGYLFSEYYMAHAIGQLLRAEGGDVRAEIQHPSISTPGKRGRPPSVDFVVYDAHKKATLAVETKWAGYSEITSGALIWDAFRLEAFHRFKGAPGLLLLAGTVANLEKLVASTPFQRQSSTAARAKTTPLLPLCTGSYSYLLTRADLPSTVANYVDMKVANCSPNAIAEKLYCERPQFATGNASKGISFAVYVWEVRSSRA